MDKTVLTREEIEALPGVDKIHFLNPAAKRNNRSLGDLTGLEHIGFHLVEVQPGDFSTETHRHYYEEECVYILSGQAEAVVGERIFQVKGGDFLGYRAGGDAHCLRNNGTEILRFIVVGQRLEHDVADYPRLGKRLFRNRGRRWNLVDIDAIVEPDRG